MLGRILKVEKNVRKGVVRIGKKNARPYTESRKESEAKRCNSTLRYECDETFSGECEFAARAEDE